MNPKINMNRVVLGGIAAGIVLFLLDGVINGVLLADQWQQAMAAMGKTAATGASQLAGFGLVDVGLGIAMVWLYAAMRPRFGAGPRTALRAGAAVWVVGYLFANVAFIIGDVLPASLLGVVTVAGAVQVAATALAGGALYKEDQAAAGKTSAARA